MDYFVLERDQRLGAVGGLLSCSANLKQGYEGAEQEERVEISGDGVRDYGCLLEHPVPLVSNELRGIFTAHHPDIQTKAVAVMDTMLRQTLNYYLIEMPQVQVIDQLRMSDLEQIRAVYGFSIPKGKIQTQPFFELNYVRKKIIVVGLTLAEHVLREGIYGVAVKRIHLKECD